MGAGDGGGVNLARLIITKIVDNQDLRTALDAGLTMDWLRDADSHSIFNGDDRRVYAMLIRHYEEHREVMDREQIHLDFDPSLRI